MLEWAEGAEPEMMSPAPPCIPNRTGPSSTRASGTELCQPVWLPSLNSQFQSHRCRRKQLTPASEKWETPPDKINYHIILGSERIPLHPFVLGDNKVVLNSPTCWLRGSSVAHKSKSGHNIFTTIDCEVLKEGAEPTTAWEEWAFKWLESCVQHMTGLLALEWQQGVTTVWGHSAVERCARLQAWRAAGYICKNVLHVEGGHFMKRPLFNRSIHFIVDLESECRKVEFSPSQCCNLYVLFGTFLSFFFFCLFSTSFL